MLLLKEEITLETKWASSPSVGVACEDLTHWRSYYSICFIQGEIKQYVLERRISIDLSSLVKPKYKLNTILTQLFIPRQKKVEEGDKAGKMLARYIKIKDAQNTKASVRTQDGKLVSESMDIIVYLGASTLIFSHQEQMSTRLLCAGNK